VKWRIALGTLAAAAVLWFTVSLVGRDEVGEALATADLSVFALGFGATLLSLTFRGMVWVRLLRTLDRTLSTGRVLALYVAAVFVKYVTPYGQVAAEPFMAYVVASAGELDTENGLAAIGSGDVLNYLPYYSIGGVGLVFVLLTRPADPDLVTYALGLAVLAVVVVGLVVLVLTRRSLVTATIVVGTAVAGRGMGRLSERILRATRPERVRPRVEGFYATLDQLAAHPGRLVAAVVFAHVGMAFLMLPLYTSALAVGEVVALPVVALAVAASKLGSLFPAPGGLGGTEVVMAAMLTLAAGVDPATALVISLLYRVATYGLSLVVGGTSAVALSARGLE